MTEVMPYLQNEIDIQTEQFDDISQYVPNARRFHETLVSRCGNEPMILLIGSLELIWSAHESSVWNDDGQPAPMVDKTRRAALRDHQHLLDAIRDGNPARAVRLAQDHLAAARRKTLAFGPDKTIEAKLMSDIGSRLDSRFRHNGRPSPASGWGYPQPRSGEGAYAQSRKESGA